jgi:hypothetical protein
MKTVLVVISVISAAQAQDAADLLQKARTAFLANRSQERYWIWTSVTTRSILDKAGQTLEALPSVTIESPIRTDGQRCNAVLAWGDGVEPYLKNASAEERCKVEEEVPAVIQMDAVLMLDRVRVRARTDSEITLTVHPDKRARESENAAKRCAGSLEGTIGLDPETYFPKRIDLTVVATGCERNQTELEDHYEGVTVKIAGGYLKGTHLSIDYALQRDKTGDALRNFWIAAHRRSFQPFRKNTVGVMISGRRFKLSSNGPDRQGLTEVVTAATEVSAESLLKVELPK